MEENRVLEELRLAESKRANLRKSFDQAQAKASEILLFTLQWKDLEDHLDLVKTELEKRSQEVELQEKELETDCIVLEERARKIEAAEAEADDLKMKVEEFLREVEAKEKKLDFLGKQVEECVCELKLKEKELAEVTRLVENCSEELSLKRKQLVETQESVKETRGEFESKVKQLGRVKAELERCRQETGAEKENLGKVQNEVRECQEEIDRKLGDLGMVAEKLVECQKQLSSKEEELVSRVKLLEERSLQLESKENELDVVRELIKSCNLDLESKEREAQTLNNLIRDSSERLDLKNKELGEIQRLIDEKTGELAGKLKHCDSIKLLIEEYVEELDAKEKKHKEMLKSIWNCSLEIESKGKTLAKTEDSVLKLSAKRHSKEKKLDSARKQLKQCTTELESKEKGLSVAKETMRKYCKDLELKQREFNSLQLCITERRKLIESREKKMLCLESSIEEVKSKFLAKQDELDSIQKSVMECSEELEAKRKEHDKIEISIKDLSCELTSKECELNSIKSKIQENLKEFESKEERYNRLGASLKEREEGFELKEKQFDARVKEFERKEQQLEYAKQNFGKCVDDFALSSFCQQGNVDQSDNLLPNINLNDGKSLQLFLGEHLKKHTAFHGKISDALKASADPAQLVLDTIQEFYFADPKMEGIEFDEIVVRRSCISLLECLTAISPVVKPQVQGKAIKLATEWKNKIDVKAENAAEVLGFLHLFAAFSLAYAFKADEFQGLLNVVIRRKYALDLCKALGLPAEVPVSDAQASDIKSEQPDRVSSNNSIHSTSLDIQENAAVSEQVCQLPPHEHDILHNEVSASLVHDEVSASLAHNEVSAVLHLTPDPAKFVLDLMQEAVWGNHQQEETGFEESLVKNCVLLLEELMQVPRQIKPHLQSEALKLAFVWKGKMKTRNPDPREALGFLLLLAAYRLVDFFNQDEIVKLSWSVAPYKHAPKLFLYLGFLSVIHDFVARLIAREQYIPAVRFICSFRLTDKFHPVPLLKKEIDNLRRCAVNTNTEQSLFEPQHEGRDVGKMRAIVELIADYKLEMDLPGDLIAKFIFQLGSQNRSAAFTLPIQELASTPAVQTQPMDTAVLRNQRRPGPLSLLQTQGALNYQGGSNAFHTQSQQYAGDKRPRIDAQALTPRKILIRQPITPCFNSLPQLHQSGNGGC